jgi:hypothetical protein
MSDAVGGQHDAELQGSDCGAYSCRRVPETNPVRRWADVRCEECGREDDPGERGWKAYIADVDEVVILCPDCAEREFGGES